MGAKLPLKIYTNMRSYGQINKVKYRRAENLDPGDSLPVQKIDDK